jgi:hypothetical protein
MVSSRRIVAFAATPASLAGLCAAGPIPAEASSKHCPSACLGLGPVIPSAATVLPAKLEE